MLLHRLLLAVLPSLGVSTPPPGFPATGNGLWFTSPTEVWAQNFPVGNGYLAAMTPGGTTVELLQLNIESLWSGGPFTDPSYNGGNKQPDQRAAMAQDMQQIRQSIFQSPTGDIDDISVLTTDQGAYGSYVGSGYLVTTANSTAPISGYSRYLDLDKGLAKAIWTQSSTVFTRTTFCSNPAKSCTQHITTSANSTALPPLTYTFSSDLESGLPTPNVTCLGSNGLSVRGLAADPGMTYELIFRVTATPTPSSSANITCQSISSNNATLVVTHAQSAWISWVGDTDYSMDAGNAAQNFTFKGVDPHDNLVNLISQSHESFDALLTQHVNDYENTYGSFQLSLGEEPDLNTPTDIIRSSYQAYFPPDAPSLASTLSKKATPPGGNPYLEFLTFNFGRYLLHSSTRSVMPANLQGKWAQDSSNPWGADYHANINIQMNYWSAEMSFADSKSVVKPLFDYIEKTWAPRGSETALILYNITRGWVTHNEMNIFGHTGMKGINGTAQYADYPESAVWMMIHVWDHFDYTNDIEWFKSQGWPLLKGVASFHLDKLIPDLHFNDSTLVVNPCNSPEQSPITLGCAHSQQLIWQLFNSIEKGFEASGDTDTEFLEEVKAKRAQMDKGLHVGSWGQLQEWKVDQDQPDDTHRHLSHLIGLYPGYAITSYDPTVQNATVINKGTDVYSKQQIINATTVSLIHRGNGTGPDADAGWEKAWRAAAWAQLGNKEEFYREITYTISEDFGPNLLSLYDPGDPDPIFQIDANLGFPGAVLNAILQAPDVASYSTPLVITLLPALPTQWATNGFIKGARVRGGVTIDMEWSNGAPTTLAVKVDSASTDSNGVQRFNPVARPVKIVFEGNTVLEFETKAGFSQNVTRF